MARATVFTDNQSGISGLHCRHDQTTEHRGTGLADGRLGRSESRVCLRSPVQLNAWIAEPLVNVHLETLEIGNLDSDAAQFRSQAFRLLPTANAVLILATMVSDNKGRTQVLAAASANFLKENWDRRSG